VPEWAFNESPKRDKWKGNQERQNDNERRIRKFEEEEEEIKPFRNPSANNREMPFSVRS